MFALDRFLLLTCKRCGRLHVISNSQEVFTHVTRLRETFPAHHREALTLMPHDIWYPADHAHLAAKYRPCSTQRLFLPQALPDVELVMYVDTDVLFLRPPEQLWREFDNFNSEQLLAAAPPVFMREGRDESTLFNKRGFNAGLLLLNLTRMRRWGERGEGTEERWGEGERWVGEVLDALKNPNLDSDQDLLNYIFNQM
ncbi:glucoside xylosyltransferase 1-like [Hyalella azteca]|uniref:UDP-D-xylose:beta-D-glucoside alpha-1,3-D-xylosyltransferase n=1 Tax=Hyalella azteca TaxID=294128 RepID=A0A979FJ87_HYAAZ|nr:glucoside xylosyltransferase 1-like [Hyalella azteca]